jgi:thiol-disulfide isomerase/thioredoxin
LAAALPLGALDTPREPAPAFHARTIEGEQLDNQSLQGQVVLIQLWATWCGFCRKDQPAVEMLLREYSSRGLVVLGVNVREPRSTVERYLAESPRSCKIVLTPDTNLVKLFSGGGFPTYVLIDREGKLAGTQRGAGGLEALRRLVAKAGLE